MTFATRITTRTPVLAVPAGELAKGATVVRRSGELLIVEGVTRPSRSKVSITFNGRTIPLPAHAPVMAYVEV